jgi:Mg-chelatase subunit ChlD
MNIARYNSRQRVAVIAVEEGPADLLDNSARSLESVEDLLMRTGARGGLPSHWTT